ncbi:hypothetical protein FA743_18155 [Paracoccus gahaiensis]|uniref:Uncharacterized protein n=1 Tax=Paracoccus gahaiensis TaxID=1706839 RepID=A0A4U0R5X7_9RHOB|nr:hypothetical protein [Paracoccus gahaiensis]TJZ89652.1 hypothetical protein FA743_18155 [Paracoccus gahaiensis]
MSDLLHLRYAPQSVDDAMIERMMITRHTNELRIRDGVPEREPLLPRSGHPSHGRGTRRVKGGIPRLVDGTGSSRTRPRDAAPAGMGHRRCAGYAVAERGGRRNSDQSLSFGD